MDVLEDIGNGIGGEVSDIYSFGKSYMKQTLTLPMQMQQMMMQGVGGLFKSPQLLLIVVGLCAGAFILLQIKK